MRSPQDNRHFGKKITNKVVISSNGNVREFRIRAGYLVAVGAVFTMFMVGYVAATAYLIFRDDLVAGSIINQARMKHQYEDRIAALRAKVDRITSRQLLDQQAVEAKVAALMRQQTMLAGRSGALENLFERANSEGLKPKAAGKTSSDDQASIDPTLTGSIEAGGNLFSADATSFLRGSNIGNNRGEEIALASKPSQNFNMNTNMFDTVLSQINDIEKGQRTALLDLQEQSQKKTTNLVKLFGELKVPLPKSLTENVGGPYIPDTNIAFEDLAENLNQSFETLKAIENKAKTLPLNKPIKNAPISSKFGYRVDPFHRRSAFHSGIDFRAKSGTAIHATGAGRVVKAGRNGGYGNMVEIDHGNGITTRYAHMSRILVKKGQKVSIGQIVGKVGSTGRSTGPHLHYEVRRSDKATNPQRFINIGRKLHQIL